MTFDFRFLYMSHISPYPIRGGEKIRAAGLIQLLSNLGSVQAIVGNEASEKVPGAEVLPNVKFHPFDFLKHMKPVARYYMENKALVQHIEQILRQDPIDVVVIDYQFYGKYIRFFQKRGIPVIYGTHNSEAQLTRQEISHYSGKKALEKWLLYHFQLLHERLYFPQADGFMVVSEQDKAYYAQWVHPQKIIKIPNFIYPELYPDFEREQSNINPEKIVMTANFTVFQNQDGLEWFLKKVWHPFRLFEYFELLLIGRGSQEILEQMVCNDITQRVSATGEIDSISDSLKDARIAVVPLRYGSGTRLKILEAMWHKIPLVVTSPGAEGIQGNDKKHFLIADDPQTFAQHLMTLQSDKERQSIIEQANSLLHQEYTLEVNQRRFLAFLKQTMELPRK
ncbi:MAG: glycosyltransferase family 4 protein [SAR324 cluster bacterium]|nr:glycosyltransferase family 4 protein [SAR324 cluster bacterium]